VRIFRRAHPQYGPADDGTLLGRARPGDQAAFAQLYERHEPMARRAAAQLAPASDVDDVVAEAFARTLSALHRGGGPTANFPGYVYTAVRRTHIDRVRRNARQVPVDPGDLVGTLVEDDGTEARLKGTTLQAAFASLKPRWRQVLWLCEVEQLSHAEAGERLGMRPNAVAALAYRARRALQDAYLREHVTAARDPACAAIRALLPSHVNGRTSAAEAGRVEAHVDRCAACRTCLEDLREARANLGVLLLPVAVTAGGAALVPAVGAAGATLAAPAGGSAAPGGLGGLGAVASVPSLAVAAAGVAVVTGAAVLLGPGATRTADHVLADPPAATASPEAPSVPRPTARATRRPTPAPAPVVTSPPVTLETPTPPAPDPRPEPDTVDVPAVVPPREPVETIPPPPELKPAPSPAPSPEPSPEPTIGTEEVRNPRISLVEDTESPRGAAWRRIVVTVDDALAGDSLRLRTSGASGYCLRTCGSLSPASTLTVWWSLGTDGRSSLSVDVLPERRMVLDIALSTSSAVDDPVDNTATHAIERPVAR